MVETKWPNTIKTYIQAFGLFDCQLLLTQIIKFSTSDNAILVFWLVHWISVTSNYTCVWPYMELNAANVARRRQMDEESRFGELSTDETQEIMDNAVPVTTEISHKAFNGTYLLSFLRKVGLKIPNMTVEIT